MPLRARSAAHLLACRFAASILLLRLRKAQRRMQCRALDTHAVEAWHKGGLLHSASGHKGLPAWIDGHIVQASVRSRLHLRAQELLSANGWCKRACARAVPVGSVLVFRCIWLAWAVTSRKQECAPALALPYLSHCLFLELCWQCRLQRTVAPVIPNNLSATSELQAVLHTASMREARLNALPCTSSAHAPCWKASLNEKGAGLQRLGGPGTTAQVHPRKLTEAFLRKAEELAGTQLRTAAISGLAIDGTGVSAVCWCLCCMALARGCGRGAFWSGPPHAKLSCERLSDCCMSVVWPSSHTGTCNGVTAQATRRQCLRAHRRRLATRCQFEDRATSPFVPGTHELPSVQARGAASLACSWRAAARWTRRRSSWRSAHGAAARPPGSAPRSPSAARSTIAPFCGRTRMCALVGSSRTCIAILLHAALGWWEEEPDREVGRTTDLFL